MFNVVIKNLIKIKMKNITSGVDFNNVFCAHFSRVFSSERLYSSYVLLRKRKRRVKNVGEIDPICDAIKLHFSYGFISNEIIITIVAVWNSKAVIVWLLYRVNVPLNLMIKVKWFEGQRFSFAKNKELIRWIALYRSLLWYLTTTIAVSPNAFSENSGGFPFWFEPCRQFHQCKMHVFFLRTSFRQLFLVTCP